MFVVIVYLNSRRGKGESSRKQKMAKYGNWTCVWRVSLSRMYLRRQRIPHSFSGWALNECVVLLHCMTTYSFKINGFNCCLCAVNKSDAIDKFSVTQIHIHLIEMWRQFYSVNSWTQRIHMLTAEQHTFYSASASVNPRKGSEQSIAYALCHHHRRCLFQLSEFTVRLERASCVTSNRKSESNRFSSGFCESRAGWLRLKSIASPQIRYLISKTKQNIFASAVWYYVRAVHPCQRDVRSWTTICAQFDSSRKRTIHQLVDGERQKRNSIIDT